MIRVSSSLFGMCCSTSRLSLQTLLFRIILSQIHTISALYIILYLYQSHINITELVVITGCSSGLGRETVKNLLATDKYHVVGAVRDVDKMEAVAEIDGFNMDNFHIMECELNSFASVHQFCDELKEFQMTKPLDRLICNAGGMCIICMRWCVLVIICCDTLYKFI